MRTCDDLSSIPGDDLYQIKRKARASVSELPKSMGTMSVLELGPVIFGTLEEWMSWLQAKGLVSTNKNCPTTWGGAQLSLQNRSDIQDKVRCSEPVITEVALDAMAIQTTIVLMYIMHHRWRCNDTSCKRFFFFFFFFFFVEKSKLSLQQWMLTPHCWCCQHPVKDAAREVEVTKEVQSSAICASAISVA